MHSISVSEAQVFDLFAQEKLGIPSLILMENAGRSVAEEVKKMVRWRDGKMDRKEKHDCSQGYWNYM